MPAHSLLTDLSGAGTQAEAHAGHADRHPFSDPAWIYGRKLDGERCLGLAITYYVFDLLRRALTYTCARRASVAGRG